MIINLNDLAWFSFFPTIFPVPEKKKKQFANGSSAELIKFSKKKKKKKIHERFSLTKIFIISFISKYLFSADYIS